MRMKLSHQTTTSGVDRPKAARRRVRHHPKAAVSHCVRRPPRAVAIRCVRRRRRAALHSRPGVDTKGPRNAALRRAASYPGLAAHRDRSHYRPAPVAMGLPRAANRDAIRAPIRRSRLRCRRCCHDYWARRSGCWVPMFQNRVANWVAGLDPIRRRCYSLRCCHRWRAQCCRDCPARRLGCWGTESVPIHRRCPAPVARATEIARGRLRGAPVALSYHD